MSHRVPFGAILLGRRDGGRGPAELRGRADAKACAAVWDGFESLIMSARKDST
jgi:hypothetical protein